MASRGKIKRLKLEPIVKSDINGIVHRSFNRGKLKAHRKAKGIKRPNKINQTWRNWKINIKGLIPYLREFKATTGKHLRPKELNEYGIKK
jgi:hypothetical protein